MTARALHTIGYEGSLIGDFLATLETAGIDLLIDVPFEEAGAIGLAKAFLGKRIKSGLGYLDELTLTFHVSLYLG